VGSLRLKFGNRTWGLFVHWSGTFSPGPGNTYISVDGRDQVGGWMRVGEVV